ncbi:MAG: UpxY family transcription antiterminator [Ignavibacteriales bacterium]|nr:UpxY family transcription antiterminator [Ignavibacteriales bacterium]
MASVNDITVKHWLALYTKPRQEFKAAIQLESVSIEYYLPTITVMKKWSDRKKKITEPLFRGYIFIHVSERNRMLAVSQKAIVKTVFFDGKPSIIPEWEIANIKRILFDSPEVFVSNKIEVGTKVKIIDGPFKDVIGVVTSTQEDKWLAVSVELLRCSVMVRLPNESVLKFL